MKIFLIFNFIYKKFTKNEFLTFEKNYLDKNLFQKGLFYCKKKLQMFTIYVDP